ncbi:MAG TPA: hypothetical protein PKW95_22440 [bacterium]|nr:hypothetical protein [bacterium]
MAKTNRQPKTEGRRNSTVIRRRKASGLCMNCDHLQDCMYLAEAVHPVTFCEMHESHSHSESSSSIAESASADPKSEEQVLGLCVNCDNRDTCTLPARKDGAWHCEEYL